MERRDRKRELRLAFGLLAGALAATGATALDELLARARRYIVPYEESLSALVAEEEFEQRLVRWRARDLHRRLQSEFLFLRLPSGEWMGFRDVYTVGGQPVRPRDDRLAALLVDPNADIAERATTIVAESARHQLGPYRTINVPVLLLGWLNLGRERFHLILKGVEPVGRDSAHRIDFVEAVRPTLIHTPEGAEVDARGSYWIREDGAVLQTELIAQAGAAITTTIRVGFIEDTRLAILVPAWMTERVRLSSGGYDLRGRAVYRNYRRFETTARLKPPRQHPQSSVH